MDGHSDHFQAATQAEGFAALLSLFARWIPGVKTFVFNG
jgi:hypothetical protein